MSRGLLAYELFLRLAECYANQEVTAGSSADDPAVILDIDTSFGQNHLVLSRTPSQWEIGASLREISKLMVAFDEKHFNPDIPIAPSGIIHDLRELIDAVYSHLPEDDDDEIPF